MIVDGKMQYLFDETGRRYLDVISNLVGMLWIADHLTLGPWCHSPAWCTALASPAGALSSCANLAFCRHLQAL